MRWPSERSPLDPYCFWEVGGVYTRLPFQVHLKGWKGGTLTTEREAMGGDLGGKELVSWPGTSQSRQEFPNGVAHLTGGVLLDIMLCIEPHRAGLLEVHQEGVHERRREGQVVDSPGKE